MLSLDYLLIALASGFLLGGLALIATARAAKDGYEDDFGFHAGPTPAWLTLGPAMAPSTVYTPDTSARASVPEEPTAKQPEGRTILGSKPPMLPADLQADDLNPRPPQRHEASDKADSL